jgi:predicted PurR-regulated permease PerM
MYLNFILENFEIIVISILLIVTVSTICILFIQNNFIKNTSNKIDNYHDVIKKNNSELAEYINTLSKITEINKQKLEELVLVTSNIEKNLLNIKAIKGSDDLISLAIELVRSGSSKEEIKSKTGLNDSEIETIYAYHKNVKN